jgi:hypothetical protein
MSPKLKILVPIGVLVLIFLAIGVRSFVRARSMTAEEATRRMLQHLDEGSAKIGGIKDTNGNWSFPAPTNGVQKSGQVQTN